MSADIGMDITDNIFRNDLFHCIVCSHVLEHVDNDRTALVELHRTMAPGGICFIMVPVYDLPGGRSIEDPSIVSPDERLRIFGQRDHVRKYGTDFIDRLRDIDWDVTQYSPLDLPSNLVRKHGLQSQDDANRELIYQCAKAPLGN